MRLFIKRFILPVIVIIALLSLFHVWMNDPNPFLEEYITFYRKTFLDKNNPHTHPPLIPEPLTKKRSFTNISSIVDEVDDLNEHMLSEKVDAKSTIDKSDTATIGSIPQTKVEDTGNFGLNINPLKNLLRTATNLHHIQELYRKAVKCLNNSRKKISEYLKAGFDDSFYSGYTIYEKGNIPVSENSRRGIKVELLPKCDKEVKLIIILTTSPGNFFNRAAIRMGWGRPDSQINKILHNGEIGSYQTIFTVGRHRSWEIEKLVEDESDSYGDILRLNYKDGYSNLTNKTVLSVEWVANNCRPKYVLKTDDDCYVNIPYILPWLDELPPSVKYVGKRNDGMPVIRDPSHRNHVPKEQHPESEYRPYCAGGGYMLSGDVIKQLSRAAKNIPQIINEDAYMGMVAHAIDIEPLDDPRFLPFIFTKKSVSKRQSCEWQDQFLMHGVIGIKQLIIHWNALAMSRFPSLCSLFDKTQVSKKSDS